MLKITRNGSVPMTVSTLLEMGVGSLTPFQNCQIPWYSNHHHSWYHPHNQYFQKPWICTCTSHHMMPIHWVSWSDWLQAWFIRFINWIQTMPTSNQLSIFSIFACVLVNTHKGLLDPLLPNISSWLLGGSLLWYLKVILPSAYFFMSIILATLYHILFSNALQAQFCNPCENHCLLNFVSTAIYVSIIQGWLLHTLDYKILIIFWALHRLRWCRVEISTFPIIKLIVVKSSRWK